MDTNNKYSCCNVSNTNKADNGNITNATDKEALTSCDRAKKQGAKQAQAAILMPERQIIPDTLLAGLARKWAEGWNEALDEVTRLNTK